MDPPLLSEINLLCSDIPTPGHTQQVSFPPNCELSETALRATFMPIIFDNAGLQLESYGLVATYACVFYEYIITLPLEVVTIWQNKLNGGSLALLTMRYSYLFSNILQLVAQFLPSPSQELCFPLVVIADILQAIALIAQLVIFILRTYAITWKNLKICVLLSVLGVAIFGINLQTGIQSGFKSNPLIGAEFNPLSCIPPAGLITLTTSIRILAILVFMFDTLVYIFTVIKTIKTSISLRRFNPEVSVISLMLRDGTMYYLGLFIINIVVIVFTYVDTSMLQNYVIVDTVQNILEMILTSRLVLNLKLVARAPADEAVATLSTAFHASYIVGSLGAPVQNELEAVIEDMHRDSSAEDSELSSPWPNSI